MNKRAWDPKVKNEEIDDCDVTQGEVRPTIPIKGRERKNYPKVKDLR